MTRLLALMLGLLAAPLVAVAGEVEFNRDIRPILSDKCFFCHGPDASHREADLRLDVEESAKGDLGDYFAIVPGKPDESAVVARITSDDPDERMPPAESHKELSAAEIELLRRWIAEGAPYEQHWSLVPPKRPAPPTLRDTSWARGDVDRFILARLESEGVQPAPEADRVTLLRRLSFDLTGLPPSAADVEAFLGDKRPDAYERLVDRLLASPHYGERMAIYWLDLVRYADTVGYHGDQDHNIAPYRDYVIAAFNANMPFDRFTLEQLAGDLLPEPTLSQRVATGYNRVLQTSHEGGVQKKEYLAKYSADRVRNVSNVWLGATLGCAECHDHKFDPYTQKDFYSLAAFFADVDDNRTFAGTNSLPTKREPEIALLAPVDRQERARVAAEIDRLKKRQAALKSGGKSGEKNAVKAGDKNDAALKEIAGQLAALAKQLAAIDKRQRKTMVAVAIEPRTMRILARGDWMDESGPVVEPAVPESLGPLATGGRRATRLDLARWLTAPDHPQTSRVVANRLWYLFLGRGLSATLDDTGSQGAWPSHPALLDYLAVELVESGWDIKHLVRLLVTSRTYRQSSRVTPQLAELDPENELHAHQARYRLPAEMVRDNALAISGLLVDRVGGDSARPYQPAGYYANLNFPTRKYTADKNENQYRRGVYVHWQRQFLHPMLKAFDAPSREECTARRPISNTPLAALALLNDPTFVEAARAFAARIIGKGGATTDARLRWAWREALSRPADDRELALLAALHRRAAQRYAADPQAAEQLTAVGLAPRPADIDTAELATWTSVARAILNLNETITRN